MPSEAGHPAGGLDARTPVRRCCRGRRPANRGENCWSARPRYADWFSTACLPKPWRGPRDALRLAAAVRTGQQCRPLPDGLLERLEFLQSLGLSEQILEDLPRPTASPA